MHRETYLSRLVDAVTVETKIFVIQMNDTITCRIMKYPSIELIELYSTRSQCFMSESVSKLAIKSFHALKKLSAPHKYKTALVHHQPVFDCEFFVKKLPRPKHCKARPTIQRIQDLQKGNLILITS